MNTKSPVFRDSEEFAKLCRDIRNGFTPVGVLGLPHAPKAHVIASVMRELTRTALIIVPDEATAYRLKGDLKTFDVEAMVYPYREFTFRFTDGRSREFEHSRLSVLSHILNGNTDAVICTAEAAAQMTIPRDELRERSVEFTVGAEYSVENIIKSLISAGYIRSEQVEGPGQFAIRGGIIDFYPPEYDNPVRVELWGDTVDSIAHFDPISQRKTDESAEIIELSPSTEIIFPDETALIEKINEVAHNLSGKGSPKAREQLYSDIDKIKAGLKPTSLDKYLPLCYEKRECLFDYMEDALVFVAESAAVKETTTSAEKLRNEELKALYSEGVLCKGIDGYNLSWDQTVALFEERGAIYTDNFGRGSFDTPVKDLITFNARQLPAWNGTVAALMEDIAAPFGRGMAIVVFAGSDKTAPMLCEDLRKEDVPSVYYPATPVEFRHDKITVLPGSISAGIEYPAEKVMFVSVSSIKTGSKYVQESHKTKKKSAERYNSVEELHRGDYVVHENYGIGVFECIEKITSEGVTKDYIKIRYDGTDTLFIPINMLDSVSKYLAAGAGDGKPVKLNKLGTVAWQKTKERIRAQSKELAEQLIKLYAERLRTKGFAFSEDGDLQRDFERRFEFVETEDQLRSAAEIKSDMESAHPMDRLLCGDVGFGKTEVALRAAFKCVVDGKQCAILVPTTILAFQHYQTVMKRFEGFAVNCEMLSRFRSPQEQTEIIRKTATGSVDILVGTHSLLSKRIEFKNLGLLIVDEEQRFGVAQKEKIKENFPGVDVLTLSATPIPRTLNMAMSGVRDMSTLEQSPRDRLPIQSFVLEYDRGIVLEAIRKELRRGGQVYYLYNFTEDIAAVAAKLQEDIPEANVGVAHGKMSEQEISGVWQKLMNGEIDILVCTTIIETGVDVPNCNTLIIENAHRLGLAQLHQIRGRVGRSTRRATALFTYPRGRVLSEDATRRLNAIREYTEFGSGFKIAMRDLEIRGAGSLLGGAQSGHMEAVGYDLYMKILNEAIAEAENKMNPDAPPVKPETDCLMDIRVDAYIPDSYISNTAGRLAMYRRIADIRTDDDAEDCIDELIDRYGANIPSCVYSLIDVALLRAKAGSLGYTEIRGNKAILLYFKEFRASHYKALAKVFGSDVVYVNSGDRSHIKINSQKGESQLETLRKALRAIEAAK